MGLRERVQRALEGPVGESERLLTDLPNADAETKLSLLISGWGRGVSAALEELAIAIDELREQRTTARLDPTERGQATEQKQPHAAAGSSSKQAERTGLNEEQLIDEARESSEETAEVRKEAERVRRDLEQ